MAGLWDPTTGGSQVAMSENAARTMKLKLQILEVTQRDDLDNVFRAARDAQAQAVNVFSSPFLASLYLEIINRAAEYRLPTIYQWREHAEAGGLISYGPSLPIMWEQDGALVAKVLKGAEPAFGSAGRTTDQVRTSDQFEDRQNIGANRLQSDAIAGRRGH